MFLSNIFDYADLMYDSNPTENYCKLMQDFLKYVEHIYFSYLYGIDGDSLWGDSSADLEKFNTFLGEYEAQTFETALLPNCDKVKDGVLILTKK